MTNDVIVRLAGQSDDADIADLMGQLGYPSEPEDVRERLARLSALPSERVLVAEIASSVVGVVSIHLIPMLHAPGNAGRITALVVSEKHRGQGVGTRLMYEAEAWAWARGCVKTEVVSADHRADSHRFYESLAYQCDERRFLKQRP